MRATTRVVFMTAALALPAAGAGAQTRDGFFLGFGAGYGGAKVECDECGTSDRENSLTGHLRLGTTLSERLSVGGELNGWFDEEDGDNATLFNATLAFYLYPTDAGLFIKAGAGVSRAEFRFEDGFGEETVSGLGWGVMAGLGYDIPIGDSTAITPVATFWYGRPGDLELEDFGPIEELSGFKHNVFEVGVGLTFY